MAGPRNEDFEAAQTERRAVHPMFGTASVQPVS
jgi:hypothetical protein